MPSCQSNQRRSHFMRILRYTPVPLFLMGLIGGVLMVGSYNLEDRAPRNDSFSVLASGRKAKSVVRLDYLPGWRVEFRDKRNGVSTGVFTPQGEFAFEVILDSTYFQDRDTNRWRPYASVTEYLREKEKQGHEVEARGEVGITQQIAVDLWTDKWGPGAKEKAHRLTCYSHSRDLCLEFIMRDPRFESEAERLFQNAEVLPRDDLRADALLIDPEKSERKDFLWYLGTTALGLGVFLFFAVAYTAVYLQVVEASRGHPGHRDVPQPKMTPESATAFESIQKSLSSLGFTQDGWFSLDDFDETHVNSWHRMSGTAVFVMYFPVSGAFRLRIVRKFPAGGILISSTRVTDLTYAPPQGIYLQGRKNASVEELWTWHLEAESLFPAVQESDAPFEPKDLYIEISARWCSHRRRDRTWLLAVEPFEECWRMYWLCGMPLRQQFEKGWTTPYWQ